jgi:hypothetical protein
LHGSTLALGPAMSPTATIDYRMIDMLRDMRPAGAPDPIASIS